MTCRDSRARKKQQCPDANSNGGGIGDTEKGLNSSVPVRLTSRLELLSDSMTGTHAIEHASKGFYTAVRTDSLDLALVAHCLQEILKLIRDIWLVLHKNQIYRLYR